MLDDDVKIGVILAMAPVAVQSLCHLNAPDLKTYGAVRLVVMEHCRAQVDIGIEMSGPMDLSALDRQMEGLEQRQRRQERQDGQERPEGQTQWQRR